MPPTGHDNTAKSSKERYTHRRVSKTPRRKEQGKAAPRGLAWSGLPAEKEQETGLSLAPSPGLASALLPPRTRLLLPLSPPPPSLPLSLTHLSLPAPTPIPTRPARSAFPPALGSGRGADPAAHPTTQGLDGPAERRERTRSAQATPRAAAATHRAASRRPSPPPTSRRPCDAPGRAATAPGRVRAERAPWDIILHAENGSEHPRESGTPIEAPRDARTTPTWGGVRGAEASRRIHRSRRARIDAAHARIGDLAGTQLPLNKRSECEPTKDEGRARVAHSRAFDSAACRAGRVPHGGRAARARAGSRGSGEGGSAAGGGGSAVPARGRGMRLGRSGGEKRESGERAGRETGLRVPSASPRCPATRGKKKRLGDSVRAKDATQNRIATSK